MGIVEYQLDREAEELEPMPISLHRNKDNPSIIKTLSRIIEHEMTEYALYLYIRTRAGTITRKSFPIFWCYESLVPYVHEEALGGWPEQKVFRAIKEGPSVGMAPYNVQTTRQEAAHEPVALQSYSSAQFTAQSKS